MKKTTIALLLAATALLGCESSPKTQAVEQSTPLLTTPTQQALLETQWVLNTLNGDVINMIDGMRTPSLDIGESFTINGHTGCNEYHGQGELSQDKFRANNLASTEKGCPPIAAALEMVINDVLANWSTIGLTADNRLILATANYQLEFIARN